MGPAWMLGNSGPIDDGGVGFGIATGKRITMNL
jgi:hypothetical protein